MSFFVEPETVSIPSGTFRMGSTEHSSEQPVRTVRVSAFSMSKNLITVEQYATYCNDTGKQMPEAPHFNPNWSKSDHPIVSVRWDEAMSYCQWLSQKTGKTYDLPTEAEWEYAARGGLEDKKYPWEDKWDTSRGRNTGGADGTSAVGSYPANGYDLNDMSGNVYQWCRDWYGDYDMKDTDNPKGALSGKGRVLRGGSWYFVDPNRFRCAYREYGNPNDRSIFRGFRVVLRGQIKGDMKMSSDYDLISEGASTGGLSKLKELIASGHNINARSPYDKTVLEETLSYHSALAEVKATALIEAGIDVNIRSSRSTPLHEAIVNEFSLAFVQKLIAAGANLEAKDHLGETPLMSAVQDIHRRISEKNRIEYVKLLIQSGANVNAIDSYANTPLSIAQRGGFKKCCKLLRKAGARFVLSEDQKFSLLLWTVATLTACIMFYVAHRHLPSLGFLQIGVVALLGTVAAMILLYCYGIVYSNFEDGQGVVVVSWIAVASGSAVGVHSYWHHLPLWQCASVGILSAPLLVAPLLLRYIAAKSKSESTTAEQSDSGADWDMDERLDSLRKRALKNDPDSRRAELAAHAALIMERAGREIDDQTLKEMQDYANKSVGGFKLVALPPFKDILFNSVRGVISGPIRRVDLKFRDGSSLKGVRVVDEALVELPLSHANRGIDSVSVPYDQYD